MRRILTRLALPMILVGCASQPPPPAPPPPAVATAPVATVVEGSPLVLDDAAKARDRVLATVTIPSIDKTLAGLAAVLNQAQPGAYEPQMLRTMLLGQMGLPPALLEAIDTGAPLGVAVVSNVVKGEPGIAIAVGVKSPAAAARALDGMGREILRRGEARYVETGAGQRIWAQPLGDALVVADGPESLSHGARVASEARHGGGEDATMVIVPDAVARHRGTDIKSALDQAKSDLREAQAALGQGGKSRADVEAGNQMMEGLFDRLAEAQTVEIGLRVGETAGLTAEGRFIPRPGSVLEKDARDTRPFEIDPGLLVNDSLAGVFAGSYGPLLLKQMELFKGKLARDKSPGAAQALKLYDASLSAIDGRFSAAVRSKPQIGFEFVYGIKDATSAARLAKELRAVKKEGLIAMLHAQVGDAMGEPGVTIKTEKVGKLQAIRTTIDFSAKGAHVREVAAVKQMFGDLKVDGYVAIVGKQAYVAVGENAKARLLALTTGSPSPPDRDLAAALAESKGRDGFIYLDLGAFARLVAKVAAASSPQAAMLGGFRARVPLYATYGSDPKARFVSFALRIPVAAFTAIGGFFQAMAGGGGPMN